MTKTLTCLMLHLAKFKLDHAWLSISCWCSMWSNLCRVLKAWTIQQISSYCIILCNILWPWTLLASLDPQKMVWWNWVEKVLCCRNLGSPNQITPFQIWWCHTGPSKELWLCSILFSALQCPALKVYSSCRLLPCTKLFFYECMYDPPTGYI